MHQATLTLLLLQCLWLVLMEYEIKLIQGNRDLDLYEASARELRRFKTVCSSLDEALQALDKDRAFLKEGGVFTDNLIDDYIALKMEEVDRLRMSTHPVEFDMYYSV